MFSTAGMALLLGRLCHLLSLRCSEETGRSSIREKAPGSSRSTTPPKFNREPKNESLEDEFPWSKRWFSHVDFWVCIPNKITLAVTTDRWTLSSMPLDSLWPMVIKTRKPCGFQRFHELIGGWKYRTWKIIIIAEFQQCTLQKKTSNSLFFVWFNRFSCFWVVWKIGHDNKKSSTYATQSKNCTRKLGVPCA